MYGMWTVLQKQAKWQYLSLFRHQIRAFNILELLLMFVFSSDFFSEFLLLVLFFLLGYVPLLFWFSNVIPWSRI